MALLPRMVLDNLRGHNFIDEFAQQENAYLGLAQSLAQAVKSALMIGGVFVLKSEEEFAEDFLVRAVAIALLSGYFPYFRQALARRIYIAPAEYMTWARSMARYVLYEAIVRGVLL